VVTSRVELLKLAYTIAADNKIDVNDCDIKVTEHVDSIEIEFWPRELQRGGGGKLFFKEDNGKYSFVKILLWQ
jgi:hypothetical protein